MNDNQILEKNKLILSGRIYPAIQTCVNNRYKILLGIFAYYSFIFTSTEFKERVDVPTTNLLVSIIFSFFVIHNNLNYWLNAQEQSKIEEAKLKLPVMEIFFAVFTFILIWGAHIFLFVLKKN